MRFTPWDWSGYRVVVIDIETTAQRPDPDRTTDAAAAAFRVVEVAAVTLTGPRLSRSWSTPVKPPIAVDPTSYDIHHISDDDLDDAADFADIEPDLTALLTPTDDEQVIVVAHKTSFDLPILRAEYHRLGLDLPDLPAIDTLTQLPDFVGLERDSRSLTGTAEALGVTHANPHTALGDATTTGEVFKALLDYCIPEGVTDFAGLLARLRGPTTHTLVPDVPDLTDRPFDVPATISAEHRATHNVTLTAATLDDWTNGARHCVESACLLLADKRQAAFDVDRRPLDRPAQLDLLDQLLAHAQTLEAAAGRPAASAGFATALGAFAPLLTALPSKSEEGPSPFAAVRNWGTTWGSVASGYGACGHAQCPDCQAGRNCPNELWAGWLATRLFDIRLRTYRPGVGKPKEHFAGIVGRPIPSDRRKASTYRALIDAGLSTVADELLHRATTRLEQDGFTSRAETMRTEAWDHHQGRGAHLGRWKAAQALGHDPAAAIAVAVEVLNGPQCPPGPARRLLVTDLRRYQQHVAKRHRTDHIDPTTPAGLAALSRRNPTRAATSLFGLDRTPTS